MAQKIYLDNNATTRVDPRVLEVVWEELSGPPANPSSIHQFGRDARNRLTKAQREIADVLGVRPSELIFTAGGTECANLILQGILHRTPGHVITSSVEHPCVGETLRQIPGCMIEELSPGPWGAVQPEQVLAALRPDTRLVTLMAVNNETGVKTDVDRIAAIAHQAAVPFYVDGVALLGKEPFVIPEGVTAMGFSGHKCHGPKGVGLVVVRSMLKLAPHMVGGHQQQGRRGGTENLAGILGLARAISLLKDELPDATRHMERLRDRLEEGILASCPQVVRNGDGPRICNTSNLSFQTVQGDALLMNLDLAGVAVSHGAACASGSLEPSRVLLHMDLDRQRAKTALRFSLSRFTTEEEIDRCIELVRQAHK